MRIGLYEYRTLLRYFRISYDETVLLSFRLEQITGFEPTTQIPLTAELHPYENHHRSLPFRAGEDEGI